MQDGFTPAPHKKKAPKRTVPVYSRMTPDYNFLSWSRKWRVWRRYRDEATAKEACDTLNNKSCSGLRLWEYTLDPDKE